MIRVGNWDGGDQFDPCSLYNWRLDWLERQILKHRRNGHQHSDEQYQRWYDEEHRVWQNNMRDLSKIEKLQKELVIVVPSHYHQCKWLKPCLASCQETGYFTLLAYDNPFHSENEPVERRVPDSATMMLADLVIMKHKTWAGGVGIPHAWNMLYAIKTVAALGFEYVFCINGDCVMQRPEGVRELLGRLKKKNADLISAEWFPNRRYCATISWMSKVSVAVGIWLEYIEKLYHFNIGNAEARMGRHVLNGDYKVIPVENPEDAHFKPPGVKGTWRHVLGFRHLHAEHKVRKAMKLDPIEKELVYQGPGQRYFNSHEIATIGKYYETGDRKYLEGWWG